MTQVAYLNSNSGSHELRVVQSLDSTLSNVLRLHVDKTKAVQHITLGDNSIFFKKCTKIFWLGIKRQTTNKDFRL